MNNLTLVHGVGNAFDGTACLMSAARIFSGEAKLSDPRDDKCSQVCPSVRAIAIRLNDLGCWSSDAERTAELMPMVPMLVGTATSDHEVLQKRAYLCADYAVRIFAPIVIEKANFHSGALKLRSLSPIVDESTASIAYIATIPDYVSASIDNIEVDDDCDSAYYRAHCAADATIDSDDDEGAGHFAASITNYISGNQAKVLLIELLKGLCTIK